LAKATEAVFVAVVATAEEDTVAAAEATADATTSPRTHPHKADEVVGEDSIAAATQEPNTSM
jgi:hypothetical protein